MKIQLKQLDLCSNLQVILTVDSYTCSLVNSPCLKLTSTMLFRVSSKSCRSGNVAKASETEKNISNLFNNAFSNLLDNAS